MFAGGILSWLVLIPLIVLFGADLTLYPGTKPISAIFAEGGAGAIWETYIRYIGGAGALAAGGIISLIKSLPLILKTFGGAVKRHVGVQKEYGAAHGERPFHTSCAFSHCSPDPARMAHPRHSG